MSSDISALIHDPTELLCLLYSKYGDINEDFNYLYLNQIFFNKLSHYCTTFKEQQYTSTSSEYLKREYHLDESLERLPQLSEYYRTYHLFFCRPFFRNWHATKLLHKYGDKQAELFYKNNLASSRSQLDKLTSRITNSNSDGSSLSSLDNQTQVGVIFNQRVRKIINSDNKDNVTITLNTEHTQFKTNSNCLITHRSRNNSFVNFIQDVVKDKPPVNVHQQHNPFLRAMCNNIKISSSRHNNVKSSKMKRSLCALTKNKNEQGSNGGCNSGHNNSNSNYNGNGNKILLSPKMMPYQPNFKSNIVEFNHNKPKQSLNIHSNVNKNRTSFHNNSNYTHNNHHNHNHHQQKLSKLSYSNATNKNSIMIMTIPTNNNGGHTTTNLNINLNFNLSSSNNTNNNTNTHTSSNNNNNNKVVQFNHHYRHHSKYSLSKVNRISLSKHKNTNKHKKHHTLISDSSALNSGGNNTNNNNNGNPLLHPSSSIPRYSSSSKGKRSNKHPKKQPSFPTTINNTNINTSSNTNTNVNTNNNNNNEHFPYSNILMNLQFQTNKRIKAVNSQRSLSNNNNSIKTPTTTNRKAHFSPNNSHINNNNNNHTCLHSLNKAPPPSMNDRLFISRNQKQLQKISVQTIRSSKRKKLHKSNEHNNNNYNCVNCNGNNKHKEMKNKSKTITTKSVDDKKTKNKKHKNVLSELTNFNWYNNIPNSNYNNNIHKHTTNQKMINQLEELIKRAKCSTNKKTHSTNQTSMNNNNNDNCSNNIHKRKHHHSKSNVKNSYILEPSYGTSRGHSSKQTQSIVNSHFRLKSSERKSMRVFSPKL